MRTLLEKVTIPKLYRIHSPETYSDWEWVGFNFNHPIDEDEVFIMEDADISIMVSYNLDGDTIYDVNGVITVEFDTVEEAINSIINSTSYKKHLLKEFLND